MVLDLICSFYVVMVGKVPVRRVGWIQWDGTFLDRPCPLSCLSTRIPVCKSKDIRVSAIPSLSCA